MNTHDLGLICYYFLQWRIAEVCQRLERDLEVLGVTAIEDRLQVNIFRVMTLRSNLLLLDTDVFHLYF